MSVSETVEISGHLMDSGILSRVLDDIREYEGDYVIDRFDVGHDAHDVSHAVITVSAAWVEAASKDFGTPVSYPTFSNYGAVVELEKLLDAGEDPAKLLAQLSQNIELGAVMSAAGRRNPADVGKEVDVTIPSEKAFGPVLCARIAGMVDTGRAVDVAKRLPIPFLADGEPEVSEDQKTITVKIKKGWKFGPPVNREITTKDIKNRSLAAKDLSPAAKKKLRGLFGK